MRSRAFTLIELLVAISIIALLSSVVLASLNSARSKGQLAAAQRFASQFSHSLSDAAVILPMEEGSGTTARNTVDGSVASFNGSPTWSTDTPSNRGYSLSFNGSNTYLTGSLPATTFAGDWTITAWFKRNSLTTWGAIFSNAVSVSDTPLMTMRNATNQFGFNRVGISEVGAYVDLGADMDGKWIFGVVQRQGSTVKVYAYKDGQLLQSSVSISWTMNSTGSYLIGRHYMGATQIFNGLIDDVAIYSEAVPFAKIQGLYAQGAKRLLAAEE